MADADREPDRPGVLKDGWNRIARDLDRAFALAGLGMHESLVLQVAREGCWVLPSLNAPRGVTAEPEPCLINLTLLAEKTGRTRQLVSRALGSLVASNILRRFEDGSVIINKDYTSWVFPGDESGPDRPRFTPDQVEYIRAAKFLGIVTSHRNPQVAPLQPTGCTDCNPQVAPQAVRHRGSGARN